jgi:hypothetical protein
MLAWCDANLVKGAWAQQGFIDKRRRDEQGIPIDYIRWYFLHDADAVAFNDRWLNGAATAEIDLQRDLEPVARTYSDARGRGATDLAARLAADAVFRMRRKVMPSENVDRRRVDELLKTAAERAVLRPLDNEKLKK